MYPWDLLGIEPTDDVRAIKRVYAKLLQTHRPDEDQAAFERLRQAYERALASVPARERPALPVLDLRPPGDAPRVPGFVLVAPPASEPVTPPELGPLLDLPPPDETAQMPELLSFSAPPPAPSPALEPPPPPETDEEQVAPELLELFDVPPELGPLLEKARRQAERKRLKKPDEKPAPPPEILLPPPPRAATDIVEEIMQLCGRHPHNPAKLQAYFAEQPDLFNIEAKSAVSLELARILVGDKSLPAALQPLVVHFFEWDTFTEQRRLSAVLKKPEKLRFIVTVAEMLNYLDSAPARGKDPDLMRRRLRRIRAAGVGWRGWRHALLHPFDDKRTAAALTEAERRFGVPAVSSVMGAPVVKFWRQSVAPLPNALQGALLFSRLTLLNAVLVLAPVLLSITLGKDHPFAVAAILMDAVLFTLTYFFFVRWLGRAAIHSFKALLRSLARGIDYINLPGRKRLLAALLGLFTIAEFFWPESWSGIYLAAALFVTLCLTLTNSGALLGLIFTSLAGWIMLAALEPSRPHYYVTSWLLACLYVQWLSPGVRLLWLWRWPASKAGMDGVTAWIGGILFVAAIVFLNVTKH